MEKSKKFHWKTTIAGILLSVLTLFSNRDNVDTKTVLITAGIATLGAIAKDPDSEDK
jgi:hypothetical protein